MRIILTLLALIWPITLSADDIAPPLPALYQVTGVAADDSLNIRAAPSADAMVMGTLAPDTTGIEVTGFSLQGNWARINTGETAGWVARRYLLRQDPVVTSLGLPAGLRCFGTEPFWDIAFLDAPSLMLRTPDGETDHGLLSTAPGAASVDLGIGGFRFVWRAAGEDITAHILPGQCTDGMSDRAYALHYMDDQGPRVGCCSLQ